MAYDEALAERIRGVLAGQPCVTEKKMFGGLAFMLDGNLCCGVVKDTLMVRVGPQQYESALSLPHARELDFTGRPMRGMIIVDPPALTADADLAAWVERGVRFASLLPAKRVNTYKAPAMRLLPSAAIQNLMHSPTSTDG